MFKLTLLLLLFGTSINLFAQTCLHTDLSKKFNFKVTLSKREHGDTVIDVRDFPLKLEIIDKITRKTTQEIAFTAGYLYENAFTTCNAVRSYTTGKNKDAVPYDYDYGDLIVADLNFDGKEDLAVKRDSGGNGGPQYNYYMQHEIGIFVLDKYLSEDVWPFPHDMDKTKKTITIVTHANVHQEQVITYKYNNATKRWKQIGYKRINF